MSDFHMSKSEHIQACRYYWRCGFWCGITIVIASCVLLTLIYQTIKWIYS